MATKQLTVEQILTMLRGAPVRIAEMTRHMSAEQLHATPADGGWSANEVLAHLRSCADVWGGCAVSIADGTSTLRAVNPRTWVKSTDYPQRPFRTSLREYRSQREELLRFLEALPLDGWSRRAVVTGAGKPLERSVRTYAESIAVHERPHLEQIQAVVDEMGDAATLPQRAPGRA